MTIFRRFVAGKTPASTAESAWISRFRENAAKDEQCGVSLPQCSADLLSGLSLPKTLPRTIWIFWAQGWDAAPAQSKYCLASWQQRNPDWRVVALDDQSVSAYVDLGSLLEGKDITPAARADILRVHLLKHFGGVWVDASTFCSRSLSEWLPGLMQSGFFAYARPGKDRLLSTWFLASEPGGYIIRHWLDLILAYWRETQQADFYFWMHYLFAEGCRTDDRWNALWQSTPWISAGGPAQVQLRANDLDAEDVRLSLSERRIPVHKLETRRASLPERDEKTPLAWLLYEDF